MLTKLGSKIACLVFATVTAAFSFAPSAEATPITYDFSVDFDPFGPLSGTGASGSFSYDSSSIIAGGTNSAAGLLTALDFTMNGITYDAATANAGSLSFDAAGDLSGITFGSHCVMFMRRPRCTLLLQPAEDSWLAINGLFEYIATPSGSFAPRGVGHVTYALAAGPVSVPEPGTLGLFGLGGLVIGSFVGLRRRVH